MPYQVQLLDAEVAPYTTQAIWPVTVGPSFQPGDMRICWFWTGAVTVTTPTGWTKRIDTTTNAGGNGAKFVVLSKVLANGDADTTMSLSASSFGVYEAVTVRNPYVGQTWAPSANTQTGSTYTSCINPSVSVSAGGVLVMFDMGILSTSPAPNQSFLVPPSGTTQLAYTHTAATYEYIPAIYAVSYGSSGTSGTLNAYCGNPAATPTYPQPYGLTVIGYSLFLQQNPDVTTTAGTATTETDTAAVTTASHLTTTTVVAGTAIESDTASQTFTPLTGYRISPPLALPQTPITNSVISWTQSTPALGSTVLVETSIDNGFTWQVATNNAPVPRLLFGTNSAQVVLSRTTLNRLKLTDATPRCSTLEVRCATDASNDELVPLGLFVINDVAITQTGGASGGGGSGGGGGNGVTGSGGGATGGGTQIVLTGVDLSRVVSRNTWDDIYFITAGTNYATAIQQMVNNRLPGLIYNFASTEHVTPKLVYGIPQPQGNDPWQDAQDLGAAIGYELFFDASGVCTLRPVPDPAINDSVWEFSDTMNPTIASLTRTLSDATTFNRVIVQGQSTGLVAPVQAIALDDDPNSPTYYLGAYGTVTAYFTSAAIVTQAQAQAAADAFLLAVKGASENVTLSTVPMPALEPGDIVTVTVGGSKVTGKFLINQLSIPLSAAQAMTATCYRQG